MKGLNVYSLLTRLKSQPDKQWCIKKKAFSQVREKTLKIVAKKFQENVLGLYGICSTFIIVIIIKY